MKRRKFIGKSASGAAGIATAAFGPQLFSCAADKTNETAGRNGKRPNILIFVSDDTGFNDVGYHGSEIMTPNLDRLASEGVELDNFYAYPVCSPTRAALLTGRPPSRCGVLGPLQTWTPPPFEPGRITLAGMLKNAGYETCISGKWHLGMRPEEVPNLFGFDRSYGYLGPWLDSYSHLTTNFHEDKSGVRQWHRDGELIDETGHVTDLVTDEAIRFIKNDRDKSKPFMLYVPYSSPHTPIQEPNKYTYMYKDSIENVSRRYFAAAMTHMDDCIGQIISTLKEEQIDQDTVVIYFSDNGGARGGDYSRNGDGWLVPPAEFYMSYGPTDVLADNTPLRGWKGTLYEGGIRVPALINWPGHLEPKKVDKPMYVCDLVPTLASFADTSVPAEMNVEGIDIRPALNGGSMPGDRTFYWRTGGRLAVRVGDWKLIHNGKTPEKGKVELFNISEDPFEKNDLANENSAKVEELKNELIRQFSMDKEI
ncbi:sulfatase-like hydrolase/transferase [Candidatus Latescibacterota bacterium]